MQIDKFIVKKIETVKNEWIEMQKNSLDFLQKQNEQNINQEVIIEFAKRYFINTEISKAFHEFSEDFTRIYFNPLVENINADMNQASADLKFYYFDELDKINYQNVVSNVPFRDDLENDPSVKPFIEKYIKSYDFKVLVSNRAVKDNDFVTFELQNISNGQIEKNTIQMNEKMIGDLYKTLFNKELDKDYSITLENIDFILKVTEIREIQTKPITSETVHLLGIEEIKTLDDAKDFVMKTVVEQLFYRELANYKENIYQEFLDVLDLPEPPKEAMEKELKNLEQRVIAQYKDQNDQTKLEKIIEENKQKLIEHSTKNFKLAFLNSFIPRSLKLDVSQEELDAEYKLIVSMIPLNERKRANISVQNVVQVLINRKIALYFLNKNKPEIYQKYFKVK